jgi:glycosyltransferase involved in cell wall biosynthesis
MTRERPPSREALAPSGPGNSSAGSGSHRGVVRVAAVIPALNEANAIANVVDGIRDIVDGVFVVDDGSTDATAERAAEAGAVVMRHEQNAGKGHAVRTGLQRVLNEPFTHVLLLDGDMQHLPDEAARLIATAAESGADAVLGERVFFRDQMPASRYHANRLGSRVLSWFVGVRLNDTQCGFRIFRVDALRPIRLRASGYEIETEMLVKIVRRGGRLASVPITAVYANERSKLRPIRDTTRTCFLAVYYRFLERV